MNLFILDTDHISLHQRNHPLVIARIRNLDPAEVATTEVTVEEQMRGRLAQLSRASNDLTSAYARLHTTVEYFCNLAILPFDVMAQEHFQSLRLRKIRIGTLDMRIAATALGYDATLITRNRRDFEPVPGLRIEDWSQ